MIENNQNDEHLVYELAHQAYMQGAYEKAAAYFRFIILFNPDSFTSWLGLSSALLMRCAQNGFVATQEETEMEEILQEALQAAKIATKLCPEDAKCLLLQLEIHLMQKEWEQAELNSLVEKAEALLQQNSLLQKELQLIKIKVKRKTSSVFDLR